MKSHKILLTAVMFTITLQLVGSPQAQVLNTADLITDLSAIKVHSSSYEFRLHSDAQLVEYKLQDHSGHIRSEGTLDLNNLDQSAVVATIKLDLPEPGEYKLRFRLRDHAGNISTEYIKPVAYIAAKDRVSSKLPAYTSQQTLASLAEKITQPGNIKGVLTETASTFVPAGIGVDQSNPWGIGDSFGKMYAKADLVINHKLLRDEYQFENIDIPAPILTAAEKAADKLHIYGHALPKQANFVVSIKKKYPSYLEAARHCESYGVVFSMLRVFTEAARTCLEETLGIADLEVYYSRLWELCHSKTFPWSIYSCHNDELNKQEIRYKETKIFTVEHSQLTTLTSDNIHVDRGWQEQASEFKLTFAPYTHSDRTKLMAYTSVFGGFDYQGKLYSYVRSRSINFKDGSGLRSSVSNEIAVSEVATNCDPTFCAELDIPYINQAVDERGKWESWIGWPSIAGGQACGAASAVMVNRYFKNLPLHTNLKSYMFRDVDEQLLYKRCKRPGAFAVTAFDSQCNQSSLVGMQNYFSQYGLRTKVQWPTYSNLEASLAFIKDALSRGNPVILSYRKPIGHILVVKGYTYGGLLIVNDPYRDIQNSYKKGVYDYTGKDALYQVSPAGYQLNYLLEITKYD